MLNKMNICQLLRAQPKITWYVIALSFRSGLADLIELDHRRSLIYTEDPVSEERTKMT